MSRRIPNVPFPEAAAMAFGRRRAPRDSVISVEFNSEAAAAFGRPACTGGVAEFDETATAAFGRSGSRSAKQNEFDEKAATAFGGGGSRRGRSEFDGAAAAAFGKKRNNRRYNDIDPDVRCESALEVQRRKAAEVAAAEKAARDRDITNLEAFPSLTRAKPVEKSVAPTPAPPGKLTFAELIRNRAAQEAAEAAAKAEEERLEREKKERDLLTLRSNVHIPLIRRHRIVVDKHEADEEDEFVRDDDDSYSEVSEGDEEDEDDQTEKDAGEFNAHLFRGY